jgi:hypothetical protein
MRGNGEGIYKHSACGNGLAGSVDCEHGTRIDLSSPGPTTHPVTQFGHDIVLSVCKEMNMNNLLVYIQIIVKIIINHIFSLQVKNKSHGKIQFVHLFLNQMQS